MLGFGQLNVLFYLSYKRYKAQRMEKKAEEKAEVGQFDFPICQYSGRFKMILKLQPYPQMLFTTYVTHMLELPFYLLTYAGTMLQWGMYLHFPFPCLCFLKNKTVF